jgi:hypothetical protein
MTATYEDLFAEIDWLLLVDTLSVIDEMVEELEKRGFIGGKEEAGE